MWRGYISHVVTNVGGVYETRKTSDQDGVVYTPVPKEIQKNAVQFLNENAFNTPQWLLETDILNRIEASGAIERIQHLQTRSLSYLLDEDRIKRMVSNEQMNAQNVYSAVNMMDDLRKGIFSELYAGNKVDAYRRNLQRSFVDEAADYVQKLKSKEDQKILKSDIIALMRGEMQRLKVDMKARKMRSTDKLTRFHWADLIARIDAGLKIES